jgi:hypothetical protein
MKHNKLLILGAASLAVASGLTVATLPNGTARAQSGSRLCGWIKTTDTGKIGYLYEAREASSSYDTDCNDAAAEIADKYVQHGLAGPTIPYSPDCKTLKTPTNGFNRHCESTCEDVGENFESSNSPKDMCDKMEANVPYEVTFDKASNTTKYKKISLD